MFFQDFQRYIKLYIYFFCYFILNLKKKLKMFHKKSLIIAMMRLYLIVCLKPNDFCQFKQACNSLNDEQQQDNVNGCGSTMKCPETFSHDCGFNICSKNITECKKYNDGKFYLSIELEAKTMPAVSAKHVMEKKRFKLFNKQIKECEYKLNKLKSADYCLNGINCILINRFKYHKYHKQIDCECPSEQSFKCGRYCTKDSLACDFYKQNKNKKHFQNITHCGNDNITTFKTNFIIW